MEIGHKIREARKKTGMTQKELGARLGLSFQAIAQWENNLRNPKNDTILRIAAALGVTPAFLMGLDDTSWMTPEYFKLKNKYEIGTATDLERDEYRKISRAHGYDPDTYEKVHPVTPTDIDALRSNAHRQLDTLNDEGVRRAADYIDTLHESDKYKR